MSDASLYRFGGFVSVAVPGADEAVAHRMGVRVTASEGCFRYPSAFATVYYGIERDYVTRYNEAKIRAFRPTVAVEGGPDVERKVFDLVQRALTHPGETLVKREVR